MNIIVRKYEEKYLEEMIKIWNEVVETGIAFPQMETLSLNSAKNFLMNKHIRQLQLMKKSQKC